MPKRNPLQRKGRSHRVSAASKKVHEPSVKQNANLTQRIRMKRDKKLRRKADRKAMMPKARLERIMWRLKPKNVYHYVFSRDGATQILKVVGIALAAKPLVIFAFA